MRENRNSIFIKLFYFFYYIGWALVFSFIPVYLKGIGFSIGEIGTFSAISALIGALIQTPMGNLSDRAGKRKSFIVLGLLINSAIFLFLFPGLTNYRDFLIVYSSIGLCTYTVLTLSSVLVLDLSLSGEIGRDYASSRMWGSAGFLTCTLFTGFFPSLTQGNTIFLITGIAFLISAVFIASVKEPEIKTSVLTPSMISIKRLMTNRQLLSLLVFYFLYYTTLTGASNYVNLLVKALGGSNSMVSFAYAMSSGIEIPFMFIMGSLSDKIGRRPLLVLASLVLPVRMLLYFLATNPLHIIGIQTMHSVTFAVMVVVPMAYVNDIVSPLERGTAQGMFNMTTGFASAFAPFLAGYVADAVGISRMYIFLMLLAIISTVGIIGFLEESKKERVTLGSKNHTINKVLGIFSDPFYRRIK